METLEDRILIELARIIDITGIKPKYIILSLKFLKFLASKYPVRELLTIKEMRERELKYIGMDIIISEDIKEDDFLLSFSKLDLQLKTNQSNK